jgi:Cu2+-exporting ATPase
MPVGAPLAETLLTVEGMRCAACIGTIERTLGALDGVTSVRVNFTARRVGILHDPAVADDRLVEELGRAGFTAHALAADGRPQREESRRLARCLAVAAFAAMNVMLLSVSIWSGATGATRELFHWLSALIALPAVAYAGRPFFASALAALRGGRTNMDVPISIGVVLACGMSLYETATGGPHAYFDGAIMLLAFLLAGRLLDTIMREKARDGVAALLRQLPVDVSVRQRDGSFKRLPASLIEPGAITLVAAGERVGADGIVEEGRSDLDQSLVTGESVPEAVVPGSRVLAGTINLTSTLFVRVTATAEETVIADIARIMEAAGQRKSRYVRFADRAARFYAPAVHTLALLSLAGWLTAGASVHEALTIAVAVLIITCPCALGLAVPVAQVVATASLMRRGVLVRDGAALEKLATVDYVLLDKTGTVTLGRPGVVGGLPEEPAARSALLALAQATRHPLAVAIADRLNADGVEPFTIDSVEEVAGQGVRAALAGQCIMLGRQDWVAPEAGPECDVPGMSTTFRIGRAEPCRITLSDQVRSDAEAAIATLKSRGTNVEFVSGDKWEVVTPLARQLRLFAHAEMSPQDKHDVIERLESCGRHVLMVGDGLNDGPALKRSWVAMAPATATDVGRQAADLIYFGDRLMPIPVAIAAARRTMRIVRQNIALAIGYNVLAVPLAIAGYVTPLIAALAMSGSSILVVVNAMRLRSAAR